MTGARRRSHGKPKVFRDVMTSMRPRLHRGCTGVLASFVIFRTLRLYRNPRVLPEIFDRNPEAIGEPGGTVLRLPKQDSYRYLFGFRILLLGSWPLSSSDVVFYFCRKSLTGLRECWCGCYDPSAMLRSFPRLEKQDFDCSMYFTVLFQ
ncbi:hypothetical protein F2Q70_00011940 [Brassica cretica]|uniref:Uncharacterized protein n=1 Tax=Brassica cretica TaxID=69181 RepID=A0A8S9LSH5_BRACR|nr:hypothetical protein F2Q70_00011940 [Brassica cretica]